MASSEPIGAAATKGDSPAGDAATLRGHLRRVEALSACLKDRPPELAALARQLRGEDALFESRIHGSSMSPAIPGMCRIAVRIDSRPPSAGMIAFFLTAGKFMVHRVAHVQRDKTGVCHLLTIGDACLAPDRPVRSDCVLGTVVAYRGSGTWHAPRPLTIPSVWHRMTRAVTLPATIIAMWIDVSAAERLVAFWVAMESKARLPIARVLRRLRLLPTRH